MPFAIISFSPLFTIILREEGAYLHLGKEEGGQNLYFMYSYSSASLFEAESIMV